MTSFPLWAERLYNRPLAIDVFKNEALCEFAQSRLLGERPERITATTLDRPAAMEQDASHYRDGEHLPYAYDDGIAVIPVRGTLVQRAGSVDAQSGLVGYNRLMRTARTAMADARVKGIWMPYDTSGGECAGLFSAAEELASMTATEGGKPIYAWLDERACSAGYALACTADAIYGRREAMAGSIAVIINVLDASKNFEMRGLRPVVIRSDWADRKARGQAGEPIDDDTVDRLTALVDDASDQLVELVSSMRGIAEVAIRSFRGEAFTGMDLLENRLVDGIISEREAYARLRQAAGLSRQD